MISLSGLIAKVKTAVVSKTQPLLCKHDYKENGQVWDRVGKKKFQLKNRKTCPNCNNDRLEIIGEK